MCWCMKSVFRKMLRERFLTAKQRPVAMRSVAIAGGRRRRQLNRGGMVASSLIFVGICFLAWERSAGVVHDDDNEAATSTDIESLVAADCVSSIVLRKRGFRLIGVLKRGRWGLISKAVRQSDGAPVVVKEIGGPLTAHAHHFSVQAIAHEYEMQRRAAAIGVAPRPLDAWTCRPSSGAAADAGAIVSRMVVGISLTEHLASRLCANATTPTLPRSALRGREAHRLHYLRAALDPMVARTKEIWRTLHEARISHNDFHFNNVVVGTTGDDAAGRARRRPFLIDFGKSQLHPSSAEATKADRRAARRKGVQPICGPWRISPEKLMRLDKL